MKKRGLWLAVATIMVLLLLACTPKPVITPPPTPAPTVAAPTVRSTVPTPAATTATATVASPATPAAAKLPAVISVATAGIGSIGYISASAFAEVIGKYTSTKASVEPAGGTARWLPLMKSKQVEFAVHCAPTDIKDAYYGQFFWKDGGPQPVVQASIGPIQPWGFVVTDPKIKTLADLKGKKVYAEIKGQRVPLEPVKIVLREGGLNPGDVEILPFADINEAAKGMSDGKAVGVFNVTSVLPLVELDRTKPLYGVPVPKEIVDKVNAEFSELGFMTWKKGDNIGKEDIPFIAQPCGMATREDMDPDIVYAILSAIYNHYDDYKDKHPVMKEWTAERAVSLIGSPVHPGAIRYFKEKGVWKDTQEKLNQKLLAQKRG